MKACSHLVLVRNDAFNLLLTVMAATAHSSQELASCGAAKTESTCKPIYLPFLINANEIYSLQIYAGFEIINQYINEIRTRCRPRIRDGNVFGGGGALSSA
jgi:hypothetical protein